MTLDALANIRFTVAKSLGVVNTLTFSTPDILRVSCFVKTAFKEGDKSYNLIQNGYRVFGAVVYDAPNNFFGNIKLINSKNPAILTLNSDATINVVINEFGIQTDGSVYLVLVECPPHQNQM